MDTFWISGLSSSAEAALGEGLSPWSMNAGPGHPEVTDRKSVV